MPSSETVAIEAAGRTVEVSSPDKVLFAERGETKLDLVHYYLAVEEPLMRAMRRPAGADAALPERRRRLVVLPEAGARQRARLARDHDRQHAERHDVARARRRRPRAHRVGGEPRLPRLPRVAVTAPTIPTTPTSCASTSTRTPGVDFDDGAARPPREVQRAARRARHRRRCPKTTGQPRHPRLRAARSRGWTPIEVRAGRGRASPRELERRRPDLITDAWWKEERGERVFVDFNQNAPHKTVFGAWCVRPRPGAQVSTPFALGRARRHRSRRAARSRPCPARVAARRRSVGRHATREPQSLEPLLELHERDIAAGLMDAPWPPVYPKMPDEPPGSPRAAPASR